MWVIDDAVILCLIFGLLAVFIAILTVDIVAVILQHNEKKSKKQEQDRQNNEMLKAILLNIKELKANDIDANEAKGKKK